MTVKGYDSRCRDLAEHFLREEPKLNTVENADELATEIQQAVEDWFWHAERKQLEPGRKI